jgi:heme/copper-type cytochrome/quinol oxidase subunit 2
VLEIVFFFALSFSSGELSTVTVGVVTLSAFFLTFYATWKYRKEDIYEMQRPRNSVMWSFIEHFMPYFITYVMMLVIVNYSIIIPTP